MIGSRSIVQQCEITGEEFELSNEQVEAYEAFDLPLPKTAPEERFRHQLAFKNDTRFFWRRCTASGAKILSVFPAEARFPVYNNELWRSEDWDPLSYGRDFDFSRLFVEQLSELWWSVPRPAYSVRNTQQSNAVHAAANVDDGFFLFGAVDSESCSYSSFLSDCRNCCDSHALHDCRLCYECVHSRGCTRVRWADSCLNCSDCWFVSNCTSCTNCLFCTNLSGKSYHIFNQPVTKAVYERTLKEWDFASRAGLALAKERFHKFLQDKPLPNFISDGRNAISGNYLFGCRAAKNCYECFDSVNLSDCNCLIDSKNCVDGYGGFGLEDCAQFVSVGSVANTKARRVFNSIECWGELEELAYCSYCEDSRHLFACVGLRGKEYCIFNKQYSPEEYRNKRAEIVSSLKERGIWGGFFPASFSAHPYNHSAASVFTPLGKVPAMMMGFKWDDRDPFIRPSILANRKKSSAEEHFAEVPLRLAEVDPKTLKQDVYLCELSGKPFTIQESEYALFQRLGIAPPTKTFEQRAFERINSIPPKKLRFAESAQGDYVSSFPESWVRPVLPLPEWDALGEKGQAKGYTK